MFSAAWFVEIVSNAVVTHVERPATDQENVKMHTYTVSKNVASQRRHAVILANSHVMLLPHAKRRRHVRSRLSLPVIVSARKKKLDATFVLAYQILLVDRTR